MELVKVFPDGKIEKLVLKEIELIPSAIDLQVGVSESTYQIKSMFKQIPEEALKNWLIVNKFENAKDVNNGSCEEFARDFSVLFPGCEIVATDNFVDWDIGAWPGGHIWLMSEGRHFDSETPNGADSWRDLPFFQRNMKKMKTITWLSKEWMGTIDKPSVVISIGDPKEELPFFACDHIDVLRVEFDDVDQDLGPEYRMFDWHDARKILQFEHKYKDHDIVVHCHAGVSRSAAVALYLAKATGRLLDTTRPCTGDYSRYNRAVFRQLEMTHYDLLKSGSQVTPLLGVRK